MTVHMHGKSIILNCNLHPNKIALAESNTTFGPNNINSRDAGDTCEEAIEAVAGDNSATGADQWFTYTATMTGSMNIDLMSCWSTSRY